VTGLTLHRPITRFAPSPTGHLHLGHVVNAIHVWGIARAGSGTVLLRIEDHDRQRSRPEFERSILEDLAWLGLEADAPLARQSERGALYQEQLARLKAMGLAYACSCSRRELARTTPDLPGEEMRYPGHCRGKNLPWREGYGVRVVLEPGTVEFTDLRLGRQRQDPSEQCGDLQAMDRLGNWTYQFCVVVDDRDQDVELVIRGEDLLESTGRQIRLARMLGRPRPPHFLHHPLIRRPDGSKLSKANRDTGLRDLRAAGQSAASLLGEAAARAGLLDRPRALRAADLPSLFTG
jgi:glutamyl/glutaminyl-tRNA synthetase